MVFILVKLPSDARASMSFALKIFNRNREDLWDFVAFSKGIVFKVSVFYRLASKTCQVLEKLVFIEMPH